jgi:hypothetical protein
LQSHSLPVVISVMMSRTQGGGVIGRRSCTRQLLTPMTTSSTSIIPQVENIPCHQNHTSSHAEVVAQHTICQTHQHELSSNYNKANGRTTYSYFLPPSITLLGNGSCTAVAGPGPGAKGANPSTTCICPSIGGLLAGRLYGSA